MQTLELNSRGYSEQQPSGNYATYDNNGYLLSLKDNWKVPAKIDNGNVVEWMFSLEGPGTPSYTHRNEFDLTKLGLPPIQTFYGKASRNLLTKTTIENDAYQGVRPIVYTTIYSYLYDNNGQVIRQITKGKQLEPGYIYGNDQFIVKDFSYFCQ